jgi:hypothetical protein
MRPELESEATSSQYHERLGPKAASQCMAGPVPKVRDNAAQAGASDARPIPGTPLASWPTHLRRWPPRCTYSFGLCR